MSERSDQSNGQSNGQSSGQPSGQPGGQPQKETAQDSGTSTTGEAPPVNSPDEATETAENPVGFGEDAGSTESGSVESPDEGGRTSVEEPV